MARVLAAGGLPEEAMPLVAKAIGVGAAAKLAAFGELAAGAAMATPAQVRHLVERGALAPQAETAMSALWSAAGASAVGNVASLIEMGALVIAGLDEAKSQPPRDGRIDRRAFPEKACPGLDPGWAPVFRRKYDQLKNPEHVSDSI